MKRLFLLTTLGLLLLTGCKTASERALDNVTESAIDACGRGQVAYVDKDDGQFGCKGGLEDSD